MRKLALAILVASLSSWASAQQKITSLPAHFANSRQAAPASNSTMQGASTRSAFAPFRHLHRSNSFPLAGFFPDFPFADFSYPDNPSSADSGAMQPDLLLQALSALTANQQLSAQSPPKSDSHSLLIELQGNNYVSLTNAQPPANSPAPALVPRSHKPTPAPELTPVTLLFRDGHREDVRDYTIADGTIYVRGDFYRDGYWNKKIQLSALDLPETLQLNQARGIRFVLPSAPNEVITRP